MAVRAPELVSGIWRNSAPLKLSQLRGRVVILDFFTYGCINCLNNLQTMIALQERYGASLTIIGVHSGKFDREKATEGLDNAIVRLGITYAVIDDASHRLWQQYAVKAWPTTVVIDRRGYVCATFRGERTVMDFKEILEAEGIAPDAKEPSKPFEGEGLRFPQKVCCMEEALAVANTGADSVWLCGYDGRVLERFEGFCEPMGMACDGTTLYIAERGSGTVTRLETQSGSRKKVLEGLHAPWDLALSEGVLYVAQAGAHQITAHALEDFRTAAVWGNRFEALRDGVFEEAQLAQPSGLSLLYDRLWFVDAESSALRYIEGENVHTAVGEGLHTFGDSDEGELLLQHPQGVVAGQYGDGCGGGRIFIADTFNGKIKVYNPDDGSMMTLLDTLHEPGGIAKKGCTLYIADTNAHAIVAFDLRTMSQSLFL